MRSRHTCNLAIVRDKRVQRTLRCVLVSLLAVVAMPLPGEAQLRDQPKQKAWKYNPKRSWTYHPKKSWTYHPRGARRYHPQRSWVYHPKRSWVYHPRHTLELGSAIDTMKHAYRVSCSHPLIAELVGQVTGKRALVGTSAPDAAMLNNGFLPYSLRADIIFHTGSDAGGWPEEALKKFARNKRVYAVTTIMDKAQSIKLPGIQAQYDPHVWLAISTWRRFAEFAARKVSEFDPANQDSYLANYKRYAGQLDQLRAYAQQALGTVPPKSRVFITDQSALGYVVRDYGFEVHLVAGLQKEFESTEKIIEFLVDRNITAIFSDNPAWNEWVEALIVQSHTAGHYLERGEPLLLDVAGTPGSYEGTYIGMMDHNLTTIAQALGGSPPDGGMQGELSRRGNRNGARTKPGGPQASPVF